MFKRKAKSSAKPKAPKAKKQKKARVKKEKPAKAAAPAVAWKKQATDIYTIMLIISLVAVLISCFLLWRELSDYGSYPWWNVR